MSKSSKQPKYSKSVADKASKALLLATEKKVKRTSAADKVVAGKTVAQKAVAPKILAQKTVAEKISAAKSVGAKAVMPADHAPSKPRGRKANGAAAKAETSHMAGAPAKAHAPAPMNDTVPEAPAASDGEGFTSAVSSAIEMQRQFAAALMFTPWAFTPWGMARKD